MSQKPKRLKKNISFSEHERDIYEYLDGIKNASALIKRLVYNHMILEQGLIVPAVANVGVNKQEQEQEVDTEQSETETKEPEVQTEEIESSQESEVVDELEDRIEELEEELEEFINEQAITVDEEQQEQEPVVNEKEPLVPIDFTDEDLKNKEILPDL